MRRRVKQTKAMEELRCEEARRLQQAKLLPAGAGREKLMRKPRQAKIGLQISNWLRSPGLKPPMSFSATRGAVAAGIPELLPLVALSNAFTPPRQEPVRPPAFRQPEDYPRAFCVAIEAGQKEVESLRHTKAGPLSRVNNCC